MRLIEFPRIWAEHKELLDEAKRLKEREQELITASPEAEIDTTIPIEEEKEDVTLPQVRTLTISYY